MNVATLALLGLSLVQAAPKTSQLFPSAITRGAFPVLVQAEGDTGTDSKIWTDDAKLVVSAGPKSGQFLIEARPDCRPGWHNIRLHNKEGATNPIPIWVDDLANLAETEPNNAPGQASPVPMPHRGGVAHVHGRLDKNGDIDGFRVHVPTGTTLVARVEASRHLGSPMDATLQITDTKGFVLAHNDDSRGLDPELTWTATEPTDVIVRVFAFSSTPSSTIGFSGASDFIYRLTVSTDATVDHLHKIALKDGDQQKKPVGWNLTEKNQVLTIEPQTFFGVTGVAGSELILAPRTTMDLLTLDEEEKPQITKFPILITGTIESESVAHQFQIDAKKAEPVTFRVFAKQWESLLDPVLTIRDATGKIVLEQDDSGNNTRDLEATYTPAADGLVTIEIRDLHNRGGIRMYYGVECTRDGLPPELQSSATNLVLKAGQKSELTLTYDKRADIEPPLKVELQGLPKGFPEIKIADPAAAGDNKEQTKSGNNGRRRRGNPSAGLTTLKYPIELTTDQAKTIGEWSGPVRILATDKSGQKIPVQIGGVVGSRTGLDHIWVNVLAVEAKKEEPKKPEKK